MEDETKGEKTKQHRAPHLAETFNTTVVTARATRRRGQTVTGLVVRFSDKGIETN